MAKTNRPRLSWWDRFLIGIAPAWGLRRLQARTVAPQLLLSGARSYEAAAGGRRTAGWRRSSTDANAAIGPALAKLRELSRDLVRNNSWARRGLQIIVNNTVGCGIPPKPVFPPKPVGVDAGLAKSALDRWKAWADSTRCDYDGRLNFYGLQSLVMRTVVEAGECLILREPATGTDDLGIPLRLRVLEPDYLDTSRDGMIAEGEGGGPIVQGIELDQQGRRVAYWLFPQHPGSGRAPMRKLGGAAASFASVRIPAEKVLHVYLQERPEQMRGVPWLASAIARLNDLEDFDDAILTQQKVAACFAAFVQDLDGAGTAIGQASTERDDEEELQPGHISYLPPGKTISFAQPPALTDSSGNFTAGNHRRVAAAFGVTYEDLTGDYSHVNFSSARMGRLAHWQNVDAWRWQTFIPQFCDGVWGWAMGLAAALADWPETPRAEWAPAPMPMLEPEREGLSYARLVRSGAVSLYGMLRERGLDPVDHLNEIAEGNKLLDKLGIRLDSDPRKVTSFGMTQPEVIAEAGDDGGEETAADDDEGDEDTAP